MCGVVEAGLALSALSAVTGTVAGQQQAQQQAAAQQAMDRVAYQNYLTNMKVLDRQADQVREQSAQQSMSQAVESKRIEGQIRVHQGETGLGQFAMEGSGSEASITDLLFQTATGRARLKSETDNNLEQLFLQEEVAFLNYRAQNASFTPVATPGFGDALLEIGGAAVKYAGNPNRKFFKDSGGGGTGTLHNFGFSGPPRVGDYI